MTVSSDDQQFERFKEAAQRLAHEDGISLDEALRRIMRAPPKPKADKRNGESGD